MKQRFNRLLVLRRSRLLLIATIFFSIISQAQNGLVSKELKVGGKMPDISLSDAGDVVYNKTGKTRFSDFKNKLVILDFWDINCGSCIAGFPKMEKLQKQFKDSIQIILVNAGQTQQEIDMGLKNTKTNPFPYELTQIVNAKLLGQFFPYEFSGNQIWIDGKGIVRLNGHSMNNHAEKIRQVLAGEAISYVKQGSRSVESQGLPKTFSLYNRNIGFVPLQQSTILPFNEEIGAAGSVKKYIVDSIGDTRTNRYLNVSLLSLYNDVFFKDYMKSWKNEIFSPYAITYLNKYVLKVHDTLRYTDYFSQRRDIDWRRSQYCYEQTNPAHLGEDKLRLYMLQDLERYFGNLYGTDAKVEAQYLSCYLLIRTPAFRLDQIIHNGTVNKIANNREWVQNGIQYHDMKLASVMQSYAKIVFNKSKQPFLDETFCSERVDITLPDPKAIKNLDELKSALHTYGLDIIEAPRKLNLVVITDKSNQ